jgi:hypothetical protein
MWVHLYRGTCLLRGWARTAVRVVMVTLPSAILLLSRTRIEESLERRDHQSPFLLFLLSNPNQEMQLTQQSINLRAIAAWP